MKVITKQELSKFFIIEPNNFYAPIDDHMIYHNGQKLSYMNENFDIFWFNGIDHLKIEPVFMSKIDIWKKDLIISCGRR